MAGPHRFLEGETPAEHCRHVVMLLDAADARVRELTIPPDAVLLELVQAARRRAWHAVFVLEGYQGPTGLWGPADV